MTSVQPRDVDLLTSRQGRALLTSLPAYDERDALALADRLRRDGHDPDLVAAVLTQARLRTRAGARWGGTMASWMLFTPDGAEQATRPQVAAVRAERYAALPGDGAVADLGCGIGVETLTLSGAGLSVDAFETDSLTARVAAANAAAAAWGAPPGASSRTTVTVHEADVTAIPRQTWTRYRAVFADPGRRRAGRRVPHPEQWSPPLSWVLDLPVSSLGVKVAPGLDHALVPADTEMAVLSDRGEVLEAALYRGALRDGGIRRSALLLPGRHHLTDHDQPDAPPPVRPVGRYLHEPDGAVIRAGLVGAVAARVDGWLIDPQIAYVSTDRPHSSPFLATYAVREVMPFSLKRLRQHLNAHGVGRVVLKKRGSAVDLDDLSSRLKLDRSQPEVRTVLLSRVGSDPIAVVADSVPGDC